MLKHLFSVVSPPASCKPDTTDTTQVHENDARPIPHVEIRGSRAVQFLQNRFSVVLMGQVQIEPEVGVLEYVFAKLEGS